ncbi:MAG: DUF5615 family PIN-like protein [Parvularculaceae bacterium]
MKFLIDMPLSPALATWLHGEGHDAAHASALGLARATDADILKIARSQGRTVITADLDYPRLLAAMKTTDPSVILFRDGEWNEAEVVARLADVLRSVPEEQLKASIIVVEKSRIRRRDLPL